jgi:hypothetical protein
MQFHDGLDSLELDSDADLDAELDLDTEIYGFSADQTKSAQIKAGDICHDERS